MENQLCLPNVMVTWSRLIKLKNWTSSGLNPDGLTCWSACAHTRRLRVQSGIWNWDPWSMCRHLLIRIYDRLMMTACCRAGGKKAKIKIKLKGNQNEMTMKLKWNWHRCWCCCWSSCCCCFCCCNRFYHCFYSGLSSCSIRSSSSRSICVSFILISFSFIFIFIWILRVLPG